MKSPILALTLCLAALVAGPSGAAEATPPAVLPDAPLSYEKHILSNGLTLLVHEDHKAPLVSVQVWYHVGSGDEVPGKTGFAHLFEHLMFNGSEHHDDEYFRPLESAGAATINGTTNTDRTNFYETVPVGALDLALWLESDRMGSLLPAVNQAKLDEQRGVVKNEKRQREAEPYAKVDELVTQNLYPAGHPYSWTTIGSMADLDAAKLADVQQWFKRYYGPNNATLVLAGDITAADAVAKAERFFSRIPPGPAVTRREEWVAPLDAPRRLLTHDRVPQARWYRVWNVPRDADPASVPLELAAELLAGDKGSPLYQRLVTQEGLATAVAAEIDSRRLSSQFAIVVSLQPGADPARVEAVVDEVLADFLAKPVADAELARRKTAAYVQRMASRESVTSQASELAHCEVFQGSPDACEAQWQLFKTLSAKGVQEGARRWLTPNHLTLIVLPEPALKAGNAAAVDRRHLPEVAPPAGIALPPLQRFTLANGIEVLLAERHEVPLVNLELFWPYGTAAQPGPGQMEMLLGMLGEGAAGKSAEELDAAYGALGAAPGTDLDADSLGVTLFAPVGNLAAALKLWSANLQQPDFPADALARRVQRKLAALQSRTASAAGIVSLNQNRLLYGQHPYGRYNDLRKLLTATQELRREVLQMLAPQVLRPDGAQLLVVGDTTAATLKATLDDTLGRWKIPAVPALAAQLPATTPPTPQVWLFDKPDAEQTVIVAADLSLPTNAPNREAAELAEAILGGLFTSRLNLNLREAKHWTYGASASLGDAKGPAAFAMQASVETPHTAEAMREMAKEIRAIGSTRPPTAAELDAARKSLIRSLPGEAETAAGVMDLYQHLLTYGLPTDHYAGYAQRLQALDAGAVTAAARALARPQALTWIVVGDLAKIEPSVRALNLAPATVLNAAGEKLR